jgi:hypothetical protein
MPESSSRTGLPSRSKSCHDSETTTMRSPQYMTAPGTEPARSAAENFTDMGPAGTAAARREFRRGPPKAPGYPAAGSAGGAGGATAGSPTGTTIGRAW